MYNLISFVIFFFLLNIGCMQCFLFYVVFGMSAMLGFSGTNVVLLQDRTFFLAFYMLLQHVSYLCKESKDWRIAFFLYFFLFPLVICLVDSSSPSVCILSSINKFLLSEKYREITKTAYTHTIIIDTNQIEVC